MHNLSMYLIDVFPLPDTSPPNIITTSLTTMTSKSDPLPRPTVPLTPPPTLPPSFEKPTPSPDIESNAPPKPRHRLIPGFYDPPPFSRFLCTNGYDIATQLLCAALAFVLYKYCPPIMPRYFPYYPGIEKSSWGMAHSKPRLTEYINTILSAVTSFVVPVMVMGAIALWGTRRFEDGDAAVSPALSCLFLTL
jgi:diacylglycerol diphosphate phosphatase/phosphatidate phosphatase